MGKIELPERTFGYEAAGIVRRIGPNVTNFRAGDRVMFMGVKTFSTVVIATESLCEMLPRDMSFADGAGIPFAFTIAIYCLIKIGNLEKQQVTCPIIYKLCSDINKDSSLSSYTAVVTLLVLPLFRYLACSVPRSIPLLTVKKKPYI